MKLVVRIESLWGRNNRRESRRSIEFNSKSDWLALDLFSLQLFERYTRRKVWRKKRGYRRVSFVAAIAPCRKPRNVGAQLPRKVADRPGLQHDDDSARFPVCYFTLRLPRRWHNSASRAWYSLMTLNLNPFPLRPSARNFPSRSKFRALNPQFLTLCFHPLLSLILFLYIPNIPASRRISFTTARSNFQSPMNSIHQVVEAEGEPWKKKYRRFPC